MLTSLDPARWSRRALLGSGAALLGAGVVGLTGCTGSNERERGPGTSDPSGTATDAGPGEPPVPLYPGSVEGAALETELAARASAVLQAGKNRLDQAGRRLIAEVRDAHLAHAAALRSTDPTDPASAPRASAAPSATEPTDVSAEPSASASVEPSASKGEPGFGATVDRLIDAERKAAAIHRRSALTAEGLGALLWGSMAVASESIVAALKAAELAGKKPDPAGVRIDADSGRAPMPVVAIIEAEQQLVRQLHAVVYGYQLALGRLTGRRRDAAAEELTRHRLLRDRLTGRLIDRKADVPVAAAAYVPSTVPRNAATAAKLVRQLETALAPFCGLWLAAAGTVAEQTEALDVVGRTTTVARRWGAAVPAWPGWSPA